MNTVSPNTSQPIEMTVGFSSREAFSVLSSNQQINDNVSLFIDVSLIESSSLNGVNGGGGVQEVKLNEKESGKLITCSLYDKEAQVNNADCSTTY